MRLSFLEFVGKVFGAAFLFGLGLLVSFFMGFLFFERYIVGGSVPVPDVRNMSLFEALHRSARFGFRLEVEEVVRDTSAPPLVVLRQNPSPGTKVRRNSWLRVVVSGGSLSGVPLRLSEQGRVVLPDVRNKSLEEARSLLEAQGLRVGRVVEVGHDTLPQGYVISQNPPPQTELSPGDFVHLLVSAGRVKSVEEVRVPDVVGLRFEEAQAILAQSGLRVEALEEVPSKERPEGIVVGQSPEAGERVARGSGIRLQVAQAGEEGYSEREGQKTLNLRFVLPSSQQPITVQVVVQDELGERVVYEREHRGEELVEVSTSTKGRGKVLIFLNGYYYWEKKLE